jgi:hypothetical protein
VAADRDLAHRPIPFKCWPLYAARRRGEGRNVREVRRCLKRAVARQLFKLLERYGSADVEVAGVRALTDHGSTEL